MNPESVFEPIPDCPGTLLDQWIEQARLHSRMANWNTMILATVNDQGRPSARPVLLKSHELRDESISLSFFTNYQSRKAREIDRNPDVAVTFHWDNLERMLRIEGRADRLPDAEADAYFLTRDRSSQLGAWASDQSAPMAQWETLAERFQDAAARFPESAGPVPRPPHWGGFAVHVNTIEFWQGRPGRLHERLRYSKDHEADSGWRWTRLFP